MEEGESLIRVLLRVMEVQRKEINELKENINKQEKDLDLLFLELKLIR